MTIVESLPELIYLIILPILIKELQFLVHAGGFDSLFRHKDIELNE